MIFQRMFAMIAKAEQINEEGFQMKYRHVQWTALLLAMMLACFAFPAAAAEDGGWEARLKAADGVVSVEKIEITTSQAFSEKYLVTFEQPLDWNDPSKGTFPQRVEIGLREGAAYNVLETNGYALNDAIYAAMGQDPSTALGGDPNAEMALMLGANYFNVEHRFFGASRPESMTNDGVQYWEYLTAENAARDYHRIYTALEPLFGKNWIATGSSRGGQMTNVYAHYFPEDMLLYAAYVAPFSEGPEDERFYPFVYTKIGDDAFGAETAKEYRDLVTAFQVELMRNKEAFLPMFETTAAQLGNTFREGTTISRVYDLAVLEFAVQFWQYQRIPFENLRQILDMPSAEAAEAQTKLMAEFQTFLTIQQPTDWSTGFFAWPYYVNGATTYGQYHYDFSYLREALKAEGLEGSLSVTEEMENGLLWDTVFTEEQRAAFTFDSSFRDAQAASIRTTSAKHLMIFGATDPWISLRMPDTDNPNVRIFIHPTATHTAMISTMPAEMQAEAVAVLRAWIGME